MSERPPGNERGPERHPSEREVAELFDELTEQVERVNVKRKLEDREGVYLWEIIVVNDIGETAEYSYMRKGRYPEGQAAQSAVHVTFFDSEGVPIGGHSVAKFRNGLWVVTK